MILGGVVNNGCGQLRVRELQTRLQMQCREAKQKLVKGQLTLFGEQASSDTENLGKS